MRGFPTSFGRLACATARPGALHCPVPRPPSMSSPERLPSRRDVLRTLSASALGFPLAGCGAAQFGLWPTSEPVEVSPPPPVSPVPTLPEAEVEPLDRVEAVSPDLPPQPLAAEERELILPPRLPRDGTIGLVAPAGVLRSVSQVREATEALEALGFRTKVGRNALARFGFLAGTDAERARDFMAMVRDPEVDAILAMRGGWGAARILPFLDFDEIAAHPKPIVGYSDVTSLLLAVYARTGIVTFHGPVGISTWSGLTADSFVRTLVEGRPPRLGPETREIRDETETVRPGVAEGPVVGGNLSVIAALAGTGYLPDFDGHVVFFEEVSEDAYRLDRLLVQLELAGVLRQPAAVVFGQCTRCSSGGSSWTAERTIREHLLRYPAPTLLGAPIGHASPVYTLPIGLPARVDADAGTMEYLRAPVA